MKKTILFYCLLLCLVSCKKDDENSTANNSQNQFQSTRIASNFVFLYNGAPEVSQIQMYNFSDTSTGEVFQAAVNGEYSLEFHGVNGRAVLQGDIMNPNYNNAAQWNIGGYDTFRVKKNGVQYIDFIADNSGNINNKIQIQVPLQGTQPSVIKDRINTFTATGGTMEGMKFEKYN